MGAAEEFWRASNFQKLLGSVTSVDTLSANLPYPAIDPNNKYQDNPAKIQHTIICCA